MSKYVRISNSEYQKKYNMLKLVKDISLNGENVRVGLKFFNQSQFPTVEDLVKHDVENNMEKYYWYLMYYNYEELFDSDDSDFIKAKTLINSLFKKYIIIIDDQDIENFKKITEEEWKALDFEERSNLLEPLSLYFYDDEFEEFAKAVNSYVDFNMKNKGNLKTLRQIFNAFFS